MIEGRYFRNVLGHFPTSVVAITTTDADARPRAMVVGTFTSVSLEPPLVSFLVDRSSSTLPSILAAGRFCAGVLAGDQEVLDGGYSPPRQLCWTGWSAGRSKEIYS